MGGGRLSLLALLALVGGIAAGARWGTRPAPAEGWRGADATAPAAACAVEPRTFEELQRFEAGVVGTPASEAAAPDAPVRIEYPGSQPSIEVSGRTWVALGTVQPAAEVGAPVDAPTERAVLATLDEWTACTNAGDRARLYALLSDDGLRWLFGDCAASGVERTLALPLLRPSLSADPPQRRPPFHVRQLRLLPDGRAAAVVATEWETPEAPLSDIWFLSDADGRWRVDQIVGMLWDLRAPATPIATLD